MIKYLPKGTEKTSSLLPEISGFDAKIQEKYDFACRELGRDCCRNAEDWRKGSYPDMPEDIGKLPIPGGIYKGFWYWDSCFTGTQYMQIGQQYQIAEDVFKAFCWELDTFGLIDNEILIDENEEDHPRSQMPLFIWLSDNLYKINGSLDFLQAAYKYGKMEMQQFWMNTNLKRPRYDVRYGLNHNDVNNEKLERKTYTGCEHGWDFSPRMATPTENWFHVLPVDLNAVLYYNENKLAQWGEILRGKGRAVPQEEIESWKNSAAVRRSRIEELFYNPSTHYYEDFDMDQGKRTGCISLAPSWLLWSGALDSKKAREVADYITEYFVKPYKLPPVCLSDNYPKFGKGCGWGFPWSWTPVTCLMTEGFIKYDYLTPVTEMLIDRFLENHGGKAEKYDVDGNPGGVSQLGWGMSVYFTMLQNFKMGFHPDMPEHKVTFRPYGIVNGTKGRFQIPGHSDIMISYFKEDKMSVGADIVSDEDYKVEVVLYFDTSTDISQYHVMVGGKLLTADQYKLIDLNDDGIYEGCRISAELPGKNKAVSVRISKRM